MDISHKEYSTGCKFHSDSDQVDTIQWVEALPDAAVLPFVSVIGNLDLEPDPWFPYPLGEQPDYARPWLNKKIPPGLKGTHYCGTAAMFANGDQVVGREPDILYAANGWPFCCSPPWTPLGGFGVGGISRFTTSGGMVPGTTCPTATLIPLGDIVSYVTDPTPGVRQWWYFLTPPISGSYVLHLHYNGGVGTINADSFHGPTSNPCGLFWVELGWGFDFGFSDGGYATVTLGVYGLGAPSVPYTLQLTTFP